MGDIFGQYCAANKTQLATMTNTSLAAANLAQIGGVLQD